MKISAHAAQKWRGLSRSVKRPPAPEPERGWTVGISWTHPTRYGTAQEEDRVLRLFFWFFPSFGLIALGEGIKMYVLDDYSGIAACKRPPWNHRWGP